MRSPPGRPQRAGGVVLLTDGGTLPTAVANFLAARSTQAFAIGGQAAAVDSSAAAVTGADRYATAAMVAAKFFTAPTSVGVAVGARFADALSGAAYLAQLGAPLLPTGAERLVEHLGHLPCVGEGFGADRVHLRWDLR